ncbi:hypothetical protein [Paenibacillus polymyxa]|uniref:hypothetical protein n=1 Tax=Paenibacillus polymyxa TaxID=1406 RepID=UPI00287F8BAE|nr:hypothetical protein [Paenibacillus polymyxa]
MNEILAVIKKLKKGKRVMFKEVTKKNAVCALLNEYKITTYVDGVFVQIDYQHTDEYEKEQ